MKEQRGQVDLKTSGTAGGGGLVAILGYLDVNEWAMIGGFLISLATFGVYVWSQRRRVKLAEQGVQETRDHQKQMRDIARGKE